jgi:hypothetical protein
LFRCHWHSHHHTLCFVTRTCKMANKEAQRRSKLVSSNFSENCIQSQVNHTKHAIHASHTRQHQYFLKAGTSHLSDKETIIAHPIFACSLFPQHLSLLEPKKLEIYFYTPLKKPFKNFHQALLTMQFSQLRANSSKSPPFPGVGNSCDCQNFWWVPS